jgi:hypothetical protein
MRLLGGMATVTSRVSSSRGHALRIREHQRNRPPLIATDCDRRLRERETKERIAHAQLQRASEEAHTRERAAWRMKARELMLGLGDVLLLLAEVRVGVSKEEETRRRMVEVHWARGRAGRSGAFLALEPPLLSPLSAEDTMEDEKEGWRRKGEDAGERALAVQVCGERAASDEEQQEALRRKCAKIQSDCDRLQVCLHARNEPWTGSRQLLRVLVPRYLLGPAIGLAVRLCPPLFPMLLVLSLTASRNLPPHPLHPTLQRKLADKQGLQEDLHRENESLRKEHIAVRSQGRARTCECCA